ncbi:hypothetical protein BC831DRAFT_427960 [Entophlyctis helioformis]|nr:hypothetical protein BC831DRAFT_427960 [Entophlyctis helioformis]
MVERRGAPAPPTNLAVTRAPVASSAIPANTTRQALVNSYLEGLSVNTSKPFLVRLATFPDRYYKSQNGIDACKWVRDQVVALQAKTSPDVKLSVRLFEHSWKLQPTVIARLEPNVVTAKDIVITGSHIDSLGMGSGRPEPNANPAADDCASGSTVVFEALRILVEKKFVPYRPIEFHWYAAEEVGLLGSAEVAEAYSQAKIDVITYLNLDQSAYVKPGITPTIGILTDNVDRVATAFLRKVVSTYNTARQADTSCGYKCTDHASWTDRGYRAVLPIESTLANAFPYNDRVNRDGSPLDTLNVINYDHLCASSASLLASLLSSRSLASPKRKRNALAPPSPSPCSLIRSVFFLFVVPTTTKLSPPLLCHYYRQ